MIGTLGFLAPWLLARRLLALPILWWLLRAVPPSPARRAFPGVRLLLGLHRPREDARAHALVAAAAAHAGAGGGDPRLRRAGAEPAARAARTRRSLVLFDGGWGDAPDWAARLDRAAAALDEAGRAGRPAAVIAMSAPPPAEGDLALRDAGEWVERLAGLAPRAWAPDRAAWAEWLAGRDEAFETLWLADGIGHGGEAELAAALLEHGPVTLVAPPRDRAGADPAAARGRASSWSTCCGGAGRAGAPGRGHRHRARTRTASSGCSARRPASSPAGEGAVDAGARPAGRAAQPRRRGCSSPTGARRRGWCSPTTRCAGARSGCCPGAPAARRRTWSTRCTTCARRSSPSPR